MSNLVVSSNKELEIKPNSFEAKSTEIFHKEQNRKKVDKVENLSKEEHASSPESLSQLLIFRHITHYHILDVYLRLTFTNITKRFRIARLLQIIQTLRRHYSKTAKDNANILTNILLEVACENVKK